MRDISLNKFNSEIKDIKEYINHINLINGIGLRDDDASLIEFSEHLRSFSLSKKIFEYKSIIMSLYGIVEKYISVWIKEHTDKISSFNIEYDKLSLKFREEHFSLSINLISKIIDGKNSKYDNLKKEDILANLNECINNTSCKLNGEAFYPFSGNLKHAKIVDALKPLGINIDVELKKNIKFRKYLEENYGLHISNRGSELFSVIDDIVTRRNEIAHGADIDDIFHIDEFEKYIKFIEFYGTAIFESIVEKETEYECLFFYDELKIIHNVFSSGTVLCFGIENNTIKIGDFIIVRTSSENLIKREILSIKKNSISHEELIITNNTNVCVKLNDKVTENQTFYIKKTFDNL